MPEASIVIVTYGNWSVTERCLHSLEVALGERLGSDWEIIVVDNDSPDETPRRLTEWSDRIRVELLPQNRNFAGGCNVGAGLAQSEVLVFLNNDTEVPAGALDALAAQVREDGVGAAGCRLLYPDGTIQHAGVAFVRDTGLNNAAMPQHVFQHLDGDLSATCATFETDSVTAGCMAVRSDVFASVHGFDERYRNGLEDIDLCLRIRVAGHRIVYRGDVTLIHHEGSARGSGLSMLESAAATASIVHNDTLFINSWSGQLGPDDELAALVWDARLRDGAIERTTRSGDVVAVVGQPSGIGPAAEECRALLVALARAGRVPCALDLPTSNVVAQVTGTQAEVLRSALATSAGRPRWTILVPGGRRDGFHWDGPETIQPGWGTMVRLGEAATALDLAGTERVVAASRAVATALAAQAVPTAKLSVLPPLIEPRPLGAGGAGVLALLPTHLPTLSAGVLRALSKLDGATPIRIIPSASRRNLRQELADLLPHAELLGPCADEGRFAELAASTDVVLAADPSELFDRRALVAASVGTRSLTLRGDGPAADVLGTPALTSLEKLSTDLVAACYEEYSRAALQQIVRDACDLATIGRILEQPR